jgi:nucleotide-binding universal stress UspA family protein
LTVLSNDASDNDRQAAESRHRELIQRIEDVGGNAGSRIEQGEPFETIGRAGQEGYSLIIVGKHGRNWIEGKIIGTTAANVCESARRPVLMVPLQKE